MPEISIRPGNLAHPQVIALLHEHLRFMHRHSPPGSVHALDLAGLSGPGITFWTAWDGEDLAGCGALKELDAAHAEIKSMRTAPGHERKGVASAMLDHLLAECRSRGYRQVSLETGSGPAFEPALALYGRFGFERCGPFASYREDPFSVFMTRRP